MLTDDEREGLNRGLRLLDDSQLKKLHDGLIDARTNLEDLNSAYPATKEFLRSRGLTNVRQLDAAGRKALTEYLLKTLESIRKPSA